MKTADIAYPQEQHIVKRSCCTEGKCGNVWK